MAALKNAATNAWDDDSARRTGSTWNGVESRRGHGFYTYRSEQMGTSWKFNYQGVRPGWDRRRPVINDGLVRGC